MALPAGLKNFKSHNIGNKQCMVITESVAAYANQRKY